jgi:hypothetical protein
LAGVNEVIVKNYLITIQLVCVLCFSISTKSQALESSIKLHKVDQDKSVGFSLSIGDEFFNEKAFNWQVSYNRLTEVSINDLDDTSEAWAQADFDFTIQTIDFSLAYRYYPKSYNKIINTLMLEFQLGAAVNLSEHKFIFRPNFDRDDIYFAEQGDINPVLAISLQKNFTKKTAINIGIRHYPSYSDFGSISSIFIGFNYRFGRQLGY